MRIRSVRHRGLRHLLVEDNPRFLPGDLTDRVRKVLTALIVADSVDDLAAHSPRGWRVHRLSGGRRHQWSVSVSGNWRITFEEEDGYIKRLDLEDYH